MSVLARSGRIIRQTLKALTDPQPEFVSLVFGGANKTPFRAIRADGAAVEGQGEQVVKAETHDIVRVEFTAAKFADETAVKAWLTTGGYDPELTITKTDGGFMVDSSLDPTTVLAMIDLSDTQGVKIYTAAKKSDETLELTAKEELHPGASVEMRQRYCDLYDCCDSCYGEGKTVAEVVANNFEGVPPGLLDLTMALYDAMRNCIREGDYAGAKAAVNEFVRMFDALTALFPMQKEETFRAFVDAIAPEIEMSKETPAEAAVETVKTDETVEAVAPAEVAEVVVETAAVETVEAEKKDETVEATAEAVVAETVVADAVVETVEKAPEDSGDATVVVETPDPVATLTALVTELTASVKSMQETVDTKVEEMVQRVAAVEETRQTRKGADVDETSTASVTATVTDEIADVRRRSMLGMRRPASK
jgi:hypothetical protein